MIIYGALLIPLIVAIILYKFFNRLVVWWEFFIPLAVSVILIFSMKAIIEKAQISTEEYWGSFVQRVEYYESWDEYIHQTCTSTCCCDAQGNNCSTTTYDCSYVRDHSPYWQIVTNNGETIIINEREYNRIKNIFQNESFEELNRPYHSKDGDMYHSDWDGDSTTAIPVTTLHHYDNRIKAADQSVFHFKEVHDEDVVRYNLKQYPKIVDRYKMSAVLGDNSLDAKIADKKFQYINGLLGHDKQVRVFVLIFKNQPIEAGLYQEWYWSGANMNEFVICIGIDEQRNVKWCKPISWTRNETLKVEIKSYVQNQGKLNLQELAGYAQEKIKGGFIRRDFEEFNYLTVEPPTWAVILTYILTLGANILVSFWIVRNPFYDDEFKRFRYGRN